MAPVGAWVNDAPVGTKLLHSLVVAAAGGKDGEGGGKGEPVRAVCFHGAELSLPCETRNRARLSDA
jgi:hypothetical protein